MPRIRHITLPQGFRAAGVHCGIKTSRQEDLAIIVADKAAATALLTTSNQIIGAPVQWSRNVLPKGYGYTRGIVINSGNANTCVGAKGLADAERMARYAAGAIECSPGELLVASTGIIGNPLPMKNVREGIEAAARRLSRHNDQAVLRAMMTTDTKEKYAIVQESIGNETITIAGVIKGAGMIAPSLATMISVITTDARIAPRLLYRTFKEIAVDTFNAVTIDSDQSTSDTAVVLASGLKGEKIKFDTRMYRKFARALREVCLELAVAMARDGEGATKLIKITVTSAATKKDAIAAAKSIAQSPLVKCAVHGNDPNWGRILMAVGKSSARIVQEKTTVKIGPITLFSRGAAKRISKEVLEKLEEYMRRDIVEINVNLGLGKEQFVAYTCDLSQKYVVINSKYHT